MRKFESSQTVESRP